MRVGINGFGRIGRLVYRRLLEDPRITIAQINEPHADTATCAYLATYDTVHGRARHDTHAHDSHLRVDARNIPLSHDTTIVPDSWHGCDLVLECSGKHRTPAALAGYRTAGVATVLVAAPVKTDALNLVYGVNHLLYEPQQHHIVTAASCTTNCLAPVASVIHAAFDIVHGSITTLHCMTNSQSVVDKPGKDLRRTRSASQNLIPTSTGSAATIGMILPALDGRLDGIAVRVPMLGASLLDAVFEVRTPTTIAAVNAALSAASAAIPLNGVLRVETAPLVSSDFRSDPHSAIVDAASTMVTNGTQIKIIAWYDNEMGYSHRMVDLVHHIGHASGRL